VLLTKRITLKLAPATTCYLGLDDSADAAALARRAAWLQSK